MCSTTRAAFEKTSVRPEQVTGISFCSQMQGMVLVDEHANALRRPMSYMDQRAGAEFRACQTHGLTISGVNAGMMLRSLAATHAASTSVKDPLWKYKWVQAHEPEVFQKAHKWLDVKEYLIARCTGEFVMTRDSAYSTFLYDTRPGHEGWNEGLCKMYGVEPRHLPRIIECRDVAGTLTAKAAAELGLCEGTPVYGGGGDATLIGVGAGKGWLSGLPAADTDIVFGMLCEEWGLVIAVLTVLCIITLAVFAVRACRAGRSSFYTIAACAATSLLVFQTCLNVFGAVDILPFTGVTLPFVSNGGSSMLSAWGMLAFLKATDTRQNASFAVRLPSRRELRGED